MFNYVRVMDQMRGKMPHKNEEKMKLCSTVATICIVKVNHTDIFIDMKTMTQ